MSSKYPGGIISKTAPTPSGPYADSTAPGVWTLEQQAYWQKLGQWPTAGNVNPSAFIENLFSTYLYTGNGSTQTITNGIDLFANGGLTWIKQRSATRDNLLFDTVRGATQRLFSNLTSAQSVDAQSLTAFNSNGFSIGADSGCNINAGTYASWTFREQAKFFDVVTYTGTGSNTTIPHNLGSAPGCMIVKCTSNAVGWNVYHRSLTSAAYQLELNTTSAEFSDPTIWNSTAPTSTEFSVGTNLGINGSGRTYVAYLFAHNAGGFGTSGSDNVISCGSVVGASQVEVNLGYEPQWILVKNASAAQDWWVVDNMRGLPVQATDTSYNASALRPNLSDAETTGFSIAPSATGFKANVLTSSQTYIYIAIRRGPMAVPTLGTSVFEPVAYTGTGTNNRIITSSITPDSVIPAQRNDTASKYWYDRLRGNGTYLITTGTNAEGTDGAVYGPQFNKVQTGYQQGTSDSGFLNNSAIPTTYVNYLIKRAPSFFDEVCYTGTGSATTVAHNLGAVPELMIVKVRNDAQVWQVYSAATGNAARLQLNTNDSAFTASAIWNTTTPTSSVFSIGTNVSVNGSGNTYVAYLFATCAGVSKVGSYTGTATTQVINCGFTAGARWVMIKRTDSTGDWYVWDSARGIIAGDDPYLLLNSSAAEVTNTDYVDTYSAGFELTSTAPSAINANGGTFIFLAIA